MSVPFVCLVIACVCFFLGAGNVPKPAVNWLCTGRKFIVLSRLTGGAVLHSWAHPVENRTQLSQWPARGA